MHLRSWNPNRGVSNPPPPPVQTTAPKGSETRRCLERALFAQDLVTPMLRTVCPKMGRCSLPHPCRPPKCGHSIQIPPPATKPCQTSKYTHSFSNRDAEPRNPWSQKVHKQHNTGIVETGRWDEWKAQSEERTATSGQDQGCP